MPCMCGDPYCASCGPAQGFDPYTREAEEFLFGLAELAHLDGDDDKVADFVARIVSYPQILEAVRHASQHGRTEHGTLIWDERDPFDHEDAQTKGGRR